MHVFGYSHMYRNTVMYDGIQSELVFVDVWWYYALSIGIMPFVITLGNFISAIITGLVLKKYDIITTKPISCPVLCSSIVRVGSFISVIVQ